MIGWILVPLVNWLLVVQMIDVHKDHVYLADAYGHTGLRYAQGCHWEREPSRGWPFRLQRHTDTVLCWSEGSLVAPPPQEPR